MSLKKIEQIKQQDKGFKLFDILIYAAVILIVAVLFIALFTTRDTSSLTGVQISVKAQVVFEYQFGDENPLTCAEGVEWNRDGEGITITVDIDGDKNIIYLNTAKKTAKMIEANCRTKQCTKFPTMTKNSDFIYCSPHGLNVQPLKKDLDDPIFKV